MLKAFLKAPSAIIGLVVVLLLLLAALIGPSLVGVRAETLNFDATNQNPSWGYLLGTDQLGRDILLRLVVATRVSLENALAAAGISAAIGVTAGASVVILSGHLRSFALRTIDTLLAFPGILIAIFIGAIIGPGATGAILGVGIAGSFSFARVTSTLALSVGGREYIAAARVLGIRGPRLLFRHVLPNIAETLLITTTVVISSSIVSIASLSFLGLGVQPPDIDWGRMLTDGVQNFYVTPAAALGPAATIGIAALAFGFVGEAAARAANPTLWTSRSELDGKVTTGDPVAVESPRHIDETLARPAGAEGPVLEVSDLFVRFDHGRELTAVDGISFTVEKGQIAGIVGESGSGKTMTAMAIAQLVPYPGVVSGTIKLLGTDITRMRRRELDRFLGTRVAVVFQDPMSSLNPALRIRKQITETLQVHRNVPRSEATRSAAVRLRQVNLPAPEQQLHKYPHELSGGMRQRVMMAMGLMAEPALLIADEPTTSLDVTIEAQIMDLLASFNEQHGTAIVLISHNLALIRQNCDKVLVMYAGLIVEELTAADLVANPLHPYTSALGAAVPKLSGSRTEPLASIPGQPPDLRAKPTGCPYHPRCPLVMDRCRTQMPPLVRVSEKRRVACWAATGGPV